MRRYLSFITLALCLCNTHAATAGNITANDTIIDGKTIQEVVVKGRDIIVKDDKLIINLSNKIKKHSFDGYSALSLLSIPGLSVDPIDETVTTNGEATMLCINGREALKSEIKTLYPKDIIRIDYYQQFDPNHPMAKSVIDFIIKVRESGGMVMAQANQNLNKAAGDDMVDWKMFNKKSQFNIQITDKYNHFTPNRGTESYTLMPFASGDVEKNVMTKPSGIYNNGIGLKLAYLYNGKTSKLQIAASLRNNHSANSTLQEQTISRIGTVDTKDFRHNDNISPTLKVYYKKNFSKKTLLETTVNASYNHTKQWRDYQALDTYLSHTQEDYYLINPIILVTHKPNNRVNMFAHLTYYYTRSNNTYTENGVPTANKLTEGQALIMQGCSFQIIPKKFRINLQLQERIQTIDAGLGSYTKEYFTPVLTYNVSLPKNTNISGAFLTGVNSPEMKYYNSGEKRIDEFQVMSGSSEQKMGRLFRTQLSLSSYHKWGGFMMFSQYDHNQKEIYEDIYCDEERNLYVHQYLNGGTSEKFVIYGELQLNLIADKLKWSGSGQYMHTKQHIGYLNTLGAWKANTSLTYFNKGWQCKIDYTTKRKFLQATGETLIRPQRLTLSVGYIVNNWSFNLYSNNPLMKSSVKTESHRHNGYISISDSYKPRTDYNMFAMRVSYRFTYGKKHKFENVDIDDANRSAILDSDTK